MATNDMHYLSEDITKPHHTLHEARWPQKT